MSGIPSLKKRLAKLEQILADKATRAELANCICKKDKHEPPTVANPLNPEEFEREMNRACPVHGFRDLGTIYRIRFVFDKDGRPEANAPKDPKELALERLLDTYETRRLLSKNIHASYRP